jgi:outer membrane protein
MKKTLLTLAVFTSLSLKVIATDYKAGDVVVRGGATTVSPVSPVSRDSRDSAKSEVYVEALGGSTPLSISVDDNTQLGLNFVYFYENNWAFEILAATPFTHDVTIRDPQSISGGLFGADVDGATLAEVRQLPPTISALYYFNSASNFKPYAGIGINYTIFLMKTLRARLNL